MVRFKSGLYCDENGSEGSSSSSSVMLVMESGETEYRVVEEREREEEGDVCRLLVDPVVPETRGRSKCLVEGREEERGVLVTGEVVGEEALPSEGDEFIGVLTEIREG